MPQLREHHHFFKWRKEGTANGSPQQWGAPVVQSQEGSSSGTWQDLGTGEGESGPLVSSKHLRIILGSTTLAPDGGVFLRAASHHSRDLSNSEEKLGPDVCKEQAC